MATSKIWLILLIGSLVQQFAAEKIVKKEEIKGLIFKSGEITGKWKQID